MKIAEHKLLTDAPGPNPADLDYAQRLPYYNVRDDLDRALQANRVHVAKPQAGETPALYERRLTRSLMPHAETYPSMRLDKLPAELFRDIKKTVVFEAMQAPARRGELVPIQFKDAAGRHVTEFEGKMNAWMSEFKGPVLATGICINGVPQRF